MRRRMRRFLLVGGLALLLAPPALSASGVTFDFKRASERLFPSAGGAANLLAGCSWSKGVYYQQAGLARTNPLHRAVWKGVSFEPAAEAGEYRIVARRALVGICGSEAATHKVMSSYTAYVPLPQTNGGLYRVSFAYAMSHEIDSRGNFYVAFRGPKAGGRAAPLLGSDMQSLADTPEGLYQRDYSVPPGTETVCLIVRMNGVGALSFRQPKFFPVPPEKPIVLKQAAQGFFTPRFELGEGQPGIVCWHWRQGAGHQACSPGDLRCVLTVPEPFVLESLSFADLSRAERRRLPSGAVEYKTGVAWYLRPQRTFSNWLRLGATLSPTGPVGTRGALSFRVEKKDGTVLSDTVSTGLVVTEKVAARAVPEQYVLGVTPSGAYFASSSVETETRVAQMMLSAGVRGIISHRLSPERADRWRALGFRQVAVGHSDFANGFIYGPAKGRPADERYRFLSPGHRYADVSACPISCSSETDYFKTVTLPWIRKALQGADGFWVNWEPYPYARQGCFCDRCRAAFARYARVDPARLANAWPAELGLGGKYAALAPRFRSEEHGKAVRTLARRLKEMTGEKGMGLIPGIHWSEVSSAWRPLNLAAEVQAIDYAQSLAWLCPWGPYVYWDTASPYLPRPAPALVTFVAARDIRRTMAKDYPGGSCPKLMGFLSGNSYGTDWIAQPEWLEIQMLAQFFNGWQASYFAGFPRGYDARYWRAYARAAETMAAAEPFVLSGERCDGRVCVKRSDGKEFPRETKPFDHFLRDERPAHVQHVAWRQGKRCLVALFNFTEETTFRVDVSVDGRRVREGIVLAPCRCRTLEVGL